MQQTPTIKTEKTNLAQATAIAERLIEQMLPYCHRVEVAGSIRRGVPDVKDVEIVAIPKWETQQIPQGLFGDIVELPVNLLFAWAAETACPVSWIKPGTQEIIEWQPKAQGRYWRGILAEGIKLDLFLCQPDNWGAIMMIRTGSADFSHAAAEHGRRHNRRLRDGRCHIGDIPVETKEEVDAFRVMKLKYVEPRFRTDARAVRPLQETS